MPFKVAEAVVLLVANESAIDGAAKTGRGAEDMKAFLGDLGGIRSRVSPAGVRDRDEARLLQIAQRAHRLLIEIVLRTARAPPHSLRHFRVHRLAVEHVRAQNRLGFRGRQRLRLLTCKEEERESKSLTDANSHAIPAVLRGDTISREMN